MHADQEQVSRERVISGFVHHKKSFLFLSLRLRLRSGHTGGADLLSYFSYPGLILQRARSPQSGKTGRSGGPVSRASGTPWATIFRA
jgi:hypothetical protein